MKTRLPISLGGIFIITTSSYLAYRLLLCNNFLHSSISDIIHYCHGLTITRHLLVLGLLPIYIGAIVFGAAVFGTYLWSFLQQLAIFKRSK